jgi:MoxR-like ATPase
MRSPISTPRRSFPIPILCRTYASMRWVGRCCSPTRAKRWTRADWAGCWTIQTADAGPIATPPQQSLVLIDEIDKAPRDFPNDILNEVEHLSFHIPELGRRDRAIAVAADPALRPILILTSNSEKGLPDAFLRRCIYYDIPFPTDPRRLWRIVEAHLSAVLGQRRAQFNEALDLFSALRAVDTGLKKPPGTAELLDWLRVLDRELAPEQGLAAQAESVLRSLPALIKNQEDRQAAVELLRRRLGLASSPLA